MDDAALQLIAKYQEDFGDKDGNNGAATAGNNNAGRRRVPLGGLDDNGDGLARSTTKSVGGSPQSSSSDDSDSILDIEMFSKKDSSRKGKNVVSMDLDVADGNGSGVKGTDADGKGMDVDGEDGVGGNVEAKGMLLCSCLV